ncbi:hypothetical protein [Streptomyces anulatus]|uniref:hypothetical protein n=1 Tax=Streptomyces anulatus TaxID=1892 RepID=UPI001C25333B|nr:hypothetical protein [Streptomyces anulatus]
MPYAVAQLVTAFEHLGPEHQALTEEAEEITGRERRGTANRMVEGVAQAGYTLSRIVSTLATAHGLKALGIDQQHSKDADGHNYTPLTCLGDPAELLCDAVGHLQVVANLLSKAYEPSRRNSDLARARCPEHLRTVLSSLRSALELLCVDLAAAQDVEAVTEYAPTVELLGALEKRLCPTVPAPRSSPTADDVAAAIRADPDVARVAAEALAAIARPESAGRSALAGHDGASLATSPT